MNIDAERLATQVKLAYDFMTALQQQAIALLKDVETQLVQSTEELRCLRPGGYSYTVNPMSRSLENPQPVIINYLALGFRHAKSTIKSTPLEGEVPPICFIKVSLQEHDLKHPEVRFGVMTNIARPEGKSSNWPKKFEDVMSIVTGKPLAGSAWSNRGMVTTSYQDGYIGLSIRGRGVRLADLPDSEAVAEHIVEPLLAMYRQAVGQN